MNYVLSIPDEVVTNTLMGLADAPEVTAEFWENRVRKSCDRCLGEQLGNL